VAGLALVLILPFLVACGDPEDNGTSISWHEDAPASPHAASSATDGGTDAVTVPLSASQRLVYKPDELGQIPILMYHGFTHDEQYVDDWTVTYDEFRGDLTWLWEHNFYIVSIDNLLHNEIAIPPGKHPVVLSFDDTSSGQFRLLKDEAGAYTPDPETAVGVIEAFAQKHPDFGKGGLFALLPYNCFKHEGEQTTCEERLTWLASHGYEIANHTWGHQELSDVSDEELMEQIALTMDFINERVSGPGNQSRVLVLPYGEFPSQAQTEMVEAGFTWNGQTYSVSAFVTVQGGLSPSPSSGDWSRWRIERFNTERETWSQWQQMIETHEVTLYTSDGDPGTVTIPNQLPDDIAEGFDPEWAQAYGMVLIRYDLPDPAGLGTSGRSPVGGRSG
jgi:peptidoglycan/xylan/chitin deacetylase (PgdA/CDA1 family)